MNNMHKIIKRLSIFLVFAMVVGLFHTEAAFAKKKAKSSFTMTEKYDDGFAVVIKGKKIWSCR